LLSISSSRGAFYRVAESKNTNMKVEISLDSPLNEGGYALRAA
jgi:hypothetical protein